MNINEIISPFRALLSSAYVLKEKFDKGENIDVLYGKFELFERDLDKLKATIPIHYFEKGYFKRHAAWLKTRLSEGRPDLCIDDIYQICENDIFLIEFFYFQDLEAQTNTNTPSINSLKSSIHYLNTPTCDAPSWLITTQRVLTKIFPNETINLKNYRIVSNEFNFTVAEKERFNSLINGFIKELELSGNTPSLKDKWSSIHPVIIKASKSRYESEHFADSVEAAFKEINEIIKKEYKKIKGEELDGDKLMRSSFSPNNPVFQISDISTESGKNIQQGYMEIFAGSIKGIRNPKVHANLNIEAEEAWEKIILASHLMRMWEKRTDYEN